MLTELCQELRNWFDRDQPKIADTFIVSGGNILNESFTGAIQTGQYFRITGSVFNDGVYEYTDKLILKDETFKGVIWLMAIPNAVIQLADDIKAWQAKYGTVDSVNMSPYNSESFGGYSYSKSGGGSAGAGVTAGTWKDAFSNRLNMWRKI